jgi:hypothetical protein
MQAGLSIKSDNFNVPAPGANSDILTTSLTPIYGAAFRITVCLATASVFNVTITRSGTTYTAGLNSSVALNAGDLYTFVFGVSTSNAYNFQVETNGVIRILQVDEVSSGVI